MKANASSSLQARDFERLERALHRIEAMSGRGVQPEWRTIASAAAASAAAHDLEGVRRGCFDCHERYRADYRAKFRPEPLQF
jgi:hypothetical protein